MCIFIYIIHQFIILNLFFRGSLFVAFNIKIIFCVIFFIYLIFSILTKISHLNFFITLDSIIFVAKCYWSRFSTIIWNIRCIILNFHWLQLIFRFINFYAFSNIVNLFIVFLLDMRFFCLQLLNCMLTYILLSFIFQRRFSVFLFGRIRSGIISRTFNFLFRFLIFGMWTLTPTVSFSIMTLNFSAIIPSWRCWSLLPRFFSRRSHIVPSPALRFFWILCSCSVVQFFFWLWYRCSVKCCVGIWWWFYFRHTEIVALTAQ